jgi:aminodeoxyfutalosine deaminase
MALLKFAAGKIFDGYVFHEDAALITDENGSVREILPADEAGENIQQFDGILCPAFINCHCHLELSHLKGLIPERTGLVDFVVDVVSKRHFPEEMITAAIEKAEDEMLASGIIATGDICNNTLSLPQKGKGRMYYHNFIEASGFHPSIAGQRFERSVAFFREYARHYSIPVESNSIVPHAPYSVSDELWDKIVCFPGNHLLTIHNQETADETEWFMNKQGDLSRMYEKMNIDVSFFQSPGKSSLETTLPRLMPNQTLILVHNVHTTEEDLQFARHNAINNTLFWCLCPNANLYISSTLPPVDLIVKHDCDIVLGTDSLASNHRLSILEEIKTVKKNFPWLTIGQLLKWATSNGARALQMDTMLGSFESGKTPGVICITPDLLEVKRII